MAINCTRIDSERDAILASSEEGSWIAFAAVLSVVVIVSVSLLLRGEKLLRPLASLAGGAAALFLTYGVSTVVSEKCDVRVGVSVVAGVVSFLVTFCVFPKSVALVGAAGLGTAAHYVYEALPLDGIDPPFSIAGLSGVYVISVASACLLGLVAACVFKDELMRLASCIVGGGGIALAISLSARRGGGEDAPPLLLLCVAAFATLIGYLFQSYGVSLCGWSERSEKRGKKGKHTIRHDGEDGL